MTAQDIKKEFSEIESLRGTVEMDYYKAWYSPKKEIKIELTKGQAICYWLLGGLAMAITIINLIVLIWR